MTPGSTSYENILEVENQGSQLSRFFKILAPVQITLESCTGLGEIDQYSIQMFSPNGCWLHENSMDALFRALSSRPLHRHDYFELMLVLEGEVIQQIEEKEYPYRAGTCCLVNRSILHNERFIGPAKLCFLGLSVDFVRSLTESASLQYLKPSVICRKIPFCSSCWPIWDRISERNIRTFSPHQKTPIAFKP